MPLTDIDGQRLGDSVGEKLGNRNLFINGAMQVAQRGTSSTGNTTGGILAVDRYKTGISTAGTWTISQSTDAPAGFSSSVKYDCTTADTSLDSTSELWIAQLIEAQNLQHLNYGSSGALDCTFSFYFKTNKTGVYTVELFQADATRTIGFEMNVTQTGWQRYEFVIPGDTSGTINNDNGIGLWCFIWMATGTGKTSGTFTNGSWAASVTTNRLSSNTVNFADSTSNECFITGYQLEVGNTATPFEHRSYDDELQRCLRYTYVLGSQNVTDSYERFDLGICNSSTSTRVFVKHPVLMRTSPTVSTPDASQFQVSDTMTGYDASALSRMSSTNGPLQTSIQITHQSGATTNRVYILERNNSTTGRITFDAEL